MKADLVLRGGRVFVGRGKPPATALALRGETVAAVGSDADVRDAVGPGTRVVELRGRLVTPGFDDAHVHFLAGSLDLLSVDLRGARDEGDLVRRLGDHARSLPPGEWIEGGNWDHEAWPSRRLPSRQAIDAATPRHPVFVRRLDGHMSLANSEALRRAGVGRQTADPPGGALVRDSEGEPTGILKDRAEDLVRRVVPVPSRERRLLALRQGLREAARLGVTSLQDNSAPEALGLYQELRGRGELTARFSVWRYAESLDALVEAGIPSGLGDDWIRLGPLKVLVDGSLGASTAALVEPYADSPGNRGLLLHEPDALRSLLVRADAAGLDLAVHAIGDRATGILLDAFAAVVRENGERDRRLRVEHAQIVTGSQLRRFVDLGLTASVQPSHVVDDLRWAEDRLGRDRCRDAYRVASFLEAGVPLAFGTDWFVEPLDPRLGLYGAVARERPQGGPEGGFFPEERISLEEALHAYTLGSARAERAEARKGTLEAGRLADCAVFAADLFALPPREVLATPVDLTVVGGRVVFEREGS